MIDTRAINIGIDSVRPIERELFIKILELEPLFRELAYKTKGDHLNRFESILIKYNDIKFSYLYEKFAIERDGAFIGVKEK